MLASVSLNVHPVKAKDGGVIQGISYGSDLDSTEAIVAAITALGDTFRGNSLISTPVSVTITFKEV